MPEKLAIRGGDPVLPPGTIQPWPPIDDLDRSMVLASLDGARDLEYVESERDERGNPIPGTLHVVWVNKTFRLGSAQETSHGQTA